MLHSNADFLVATVISNLEIILIQGLENDERYCTKVELSYRKVSLENLWPAIRIVATDFTDVAKVQSMKLVQPVRNWLEDKKNDKKSGSISRTQLRS